MAIVAKDENIQIEKLSLGSFGTNAYIVVCQKTQYSVLIDTPAEPETLLEKRPVLLRLRAQHRVRPLFLVGRGQCRSVRDRIRRRGDFRECLSLQAACQENGIQIR